MMLFKYWNRLIRLGLTFVVSYFEQPAQVLWLVISIEWKNYQRMNVKVNAVQGEE